MRWRGSSVYCEGVDVYVVERILCAVRVLMCTWWRGSSVYCEGVDVYVVERILCVL